jgi:hypothetical protein
VPPPIAAAYFWLVVVSYIVGWRPSKEVKWIIFWYALVAQIIAQINAITSTPHLHPCRTSSSTALFLLPLTVGRFLCFIPKRRPPKAIDRLISLFKTVRIESHSSRFGGTFFLQPDRLCFFSEPRREKQKTKIRHTEPGRYDGRQRLWLFLLPVGRPRPFCSRERVYRAMGDAPYRRRHENRAVVYDPTIHHWLLVRKKSSSWALPAMASTAADRPSAAVPLEGACLQSHGRRPLPPAP